MDTMITALTDKPLTKRPDAHHIAIRYNVVMGVLECSECPTLTQSCTNSLVEAAKGWSRERINRHLRISSWNASPALTTQSIFDARQTRWNFVITLNLDISAAGAIFGVTPGQRAMLVLPSLVDLRGSTAIIRRTLALTYYGVNSYFAESWQERLPGTYVAHSTSRSWLRGSEILMDFYTQSGSPE